MAWALKNMNTGKVMKKRYGNKRDAEEARQDLNKPSIHRIVKAPRRYNSEYYNIGGESVPVSAIDEKLFQYNQDELLSQGFDPSVFETPMVDPGIPPVEPEPEPQPTVEQVSQPSVPESNVGSGLSGETETVVQPETTPTPTTPESGGTTTVPGGTTYPTNPSPSPTTSQSSSATTTSGSYGMSSNQPSTTTSQTTSAETDYVEIMEESMDDYEWGALALGGLGVVAAGGLAYSLTGDDEDERDYDYTLTKQPERRMIQDMTELDIDDILDTMVYATIPGTAYVDGSRISSMQPREYQRSTAETNAAWNNYARLTDPRARDDLKLLLEIDFSRDGPLSKAHKAGKLALSMDRRSWEIDTPKGLKPYTAANFGKAPGFSRLPAKVKGYFYDDTGLVISDVDVQQRKADGSYVKLELKGNSLSFIDEKGRKRVMTGVLPGTYISSLGNTPEGILSGASYIDPSTVKSDSIAEAEAELKKLEAQLARASRGSAILSTDDILKQIQAEEAAEERQRKRDEERKKRLEAQEKAAKEKEEQLRKAKAEAFENLAASFGGIVDDSAVSPARNMLDKRWVQSYGATGLGGQVPRDAIQSFSYEVGPSGPTLKITYTDDYATSVLLREPGFNTEVWSRSRLVDLQVVPASYGPGFTPFFKTAFGTLDPNEPSWSIGTVNIPTATELARANISTAGKTAGARMRPLSTFTRRIGYQRNINGNQFIGANRALPKGSAQFLANRVRSRGRNSRVIPTAGGYRIYVGNRRSNT